MLYRAILHELSIFTLYDKHLAIPEAVAEAHPSPTEIAASEVTMEPARETLPETGDETLIPDTEMDIEIGVMEVPAGEELGASSVQLDVVGSDVVVTIDTALLGSPERDRESRTQKLSAYLSMRFHSTPPP